MNNNYILAYYQAINDGSVVVGKYVRMLYEYIVKGLEQKLFFYEPKKARAAIASVEQFQRDHGLKVDGAAGKQTQRLLFSPWRRNEHHLNFPHNKVSALHKFSCFRDVFFINVVTLEDTGHIEIYISFINR